MDVSLDLGIVAREPAPDVVELCVEAEERGFGGLWVADSQAIFRDAFAILAVAAARTRCTRRRAGAAWRNVLGQ